MKKVNKNYQGICQLQQLPKGTIFKFVRKDGTLSNSTYIIDELDGYERSEKKYSYTNYWDISKGGLKKGQTLVSTDFEF